jgi:hypothetical protein
MILSKRERQIALATFVVLAIFGLDRFLITPVQERQAEAATQLQQTLDGLERARALFDRRHQLAPEWQQMVEADLQAEPAAAESAVLHALRNWSEQTHLSLTSLRPGKATDMGELRELTFRASGEGGMSAVTGFLWQIETSSLPIRLTDLHIGTRKEGADDLTVDLGISALCHGSGKTASTTTVAVRAPQKEPTDE